MIDPAGNALAYLLIWSVERKKSFERLTPDVKVIKLSLLLMKRPNNLERSSMASFSGVA